MPPTTKSKREKRNKRPYDPTTAKPGSSSTPAATTLPPSQAGKEEISLTNEASSSRNGSTSTNGDPGLSKKQKRKRKRSLASNPDIINLTNQAASPVPGPATEKDKGESSQGDIMAKYMALSAPLALPSPSQSPIKSSLFFVQKKRQKSSGISPKSHPKDATAVPSVKRDDARVDILKRQLAMTRAEAEKERDGLSKRIKELEEVVQAKTNEIEQKGKEVEGQQLVHEQLKEAVTCQVCFETLNDPHILSCGHHACKTCLISWFQTHGAYVHFIPEDDLTQMNLSYRTKTCHVCRSWIYSRPVRMYHLMSILEPLGLNFHLPTVSQAKDERDHDPWKNIFPPARDSYRIKDNGDGVERCPECIGEIDAGICTGCGIEFSDVDDDWEDEDDFERELDRDDSDDSEQSVIAIDRAREALFGFASSQALPPDLVEAINNVNTETRNRRRPQPFTERRRGRQLPAGLAGVLDLMAEEDDEVGERGDYPDESDMDGSDDSDEEGYEDSFIDDGDEEAGEAEGSDDGGSSLGSLDDGEIEAGEEGEDEDGASSASGELPIDELRRRRNRRYAARPVRSPEVQARRSAPSRSRSRRVVESESE